MIKVNEEMFEAEVVNSKLPVLVDFMANWCPPCKVLAPILEDLSRDFEGKMRFVKVDIDESPELSERFDVGSIPTLILFKDGEIKEEALGLRSKASLRQIIEKHV